MVDGEIARALGGNMYSYGVLLRHPFCRYDHRTTRCCPEASGIVRVSLVSKIKIAITAVAGSCFFGGDGEKKMSVTCANLRGRIERKCTVICCACVLSQTTSGCHPIINPIICKIPLRFFFHFYAVLLVQRTSKRRPLQKLWTVR